MAEEAGGVARLDGLLEVSYPPDPDLDVEVEAALRQLVAVSPVHLQVARSSGQVSLMPDTSPFAFRAGESPSQHLLPAVRELVETVRLRSECRVESTLRVQEFAGDAVMEGVFTYQEPDGVTVAARERPARPGERPEVPDEGFGVRAESFARRYQWPLVGLAAVVAVVGFFGWQLGWWGIGAGTVEGPAIDAGPLQGIVTFEKVRWRKDVVGFEIGRGADWARFDEVGERCSLRPKVFRVIFRKEGRPVGPALPLDLTGLAESTEEGTAKVDLPYSGSAFDEVLVCR
jgi:hypothetical protein